MPRKKGIKCEAVTFDKTSKSIKPCIFEQKPNKNGEMTLYCNSHQYWLNFTQEIIDGIKNSTNDYHTCGRCRMWHNGKNDNCYDCLSNTKQHSLKEKESKMDLKCIFTVKKNENDVGHRCQYCKLTNIQYCEKHKRFENYTQEMMTNLKFCSTCKCQDYFVGFKTCDDCRGVGKIQNKKNSTTSIKSKCMECNNYADANGYCGKHQLNAWLKQVESEGLKPCANYKRGCRTKLELNLPTSNCETCLLKEREKYKLLTQKAKETCETKNCECKEIVLEIEMINKLENLLTLLFEKKFEYEDLTYLINKYGTLEYIEKFNIEFDAYKFHFQQMYEKKHDIEFVNFVDSFDNTDEAILIVSQKCSQKNSFQLLKEIKNDLKKRLKNNTMLCVNCMNEFNIDQFKNKHGKFTKWCSTCRQKMNEIDEKRGKRIRDYKTYEQTEERKKQKKYWNESNYDKIVEYQTKYKSSQMEKLGDKYWEDRAKQSKNWRTSNPTKVLQNNENKKANVIATLKYYKYRARANHIQWNITDEHAFKLLQSNCNYCGEIDKYDISGIDRIDSKIGYVDKNVVSCCEICNFMKCTMSINVYLKKIKHILSCMMISNELYCCSNLFENHCSANYEEYKKRATEKKQVEFELSMEEFNKLKRLDCYMCLKTTTFANLNGIDCINNDIGYTLENCMPCCYDCNKMKNNYDMYDVIRKMFKTIYPQYNTEHIKSTLSSYIKIKNKINTELINSNDQELLKKMETINESCVKKYKSIQNKKQKYGITNYNRLHALYEQKSQSIKKNDIVKLKKVESEIEQIQNNPEIKHTKIKLTKEEKTRKKSEQKKMQREKRKLLIGDVEYRKEMATEKRKQKEKKLLEKELANKK